YGVAKMTEAEALQFARNTIQKLGYSLRETYTDQTPEITRPPIIDGNVVPRYRFQWPDPLFGTPIDVEVDVSNRVIKRVALFSPTFRRPPPIIAGSFDLKPASPSPLPEPKSSDWTTGWLAALLPQASWLGSTL